MFTKNRESAFWKKGMFCDGELQRSVRIPQGSEDFSFCCCVTPIIIITTSLPIHLQHMELRDAFYSTNWISGNSGSKSSGTESFRKFVLKILVHLSRLSFFLEIWKFRKIPLPFDISTRYELVPVHLVVKSYKMVASLSSLHYTGCKMICHSLSLFLIAYSPRER